MALGGDPSTIPYHALLRETPEAHLGRDEGLRVLGDGGPELLQLRQHVRRQAADLRVRESGA